MEIFMWILMAIFGVGILVVRTFESSRTFGYISFVVCCVTFALLEYIQLMKYLDPAWTGAIVAISLIILIRVAFWIKPIRSRKKNK